MRHITSEQFLALNFSVSTCHLLTEIFDQFYDEEENIILYNSYCNGDACITSKCGIALKFSWQALGGDQGYQDAYIFSIDISSNPEYHLQKAIIVDHEKLEIDEQDYIEVFKALLKNTPWQNGVKPLLPIYKGKEN